uniref:Uncharacterized protein n=1 Tax=Anguilla anguilla TaxID=7936 RepID=A0A0E9VVX9_ANGAN
MKVSARRRFAIRSFRNQAIDCLDYLFIYCLFFMPE